MTTTDHKLQDAIKMLLDDLVDHGFEDFDPPEILENIADVQTYEEAGVLTTNAGVVIRMADGTEWQVNIVRSR